MFSSVPSSAGTPAPFCLKCQTEQWALPLGRRTGGLDLDVLGLLCTAEAILEWAGECMVQHNIMCFET